MWYERNPAEATAKCLNCDLHVSRHVTVQTRTGLHLACPTTLAAALRGDGGDPSRSRVYPAGPLAGHFRSAHEPAGTFKPWSAMCPACVRWSHDQVKQMLTPTGQRPMFSEHPRRIVPRKLLLSGTPDALRLTGLQAAVLRGWLPASHPAHAYYSRYSAILNARIVLDS